MTLSAKTDSEDSPNLRLVMNFPDNKSYREACEKEVETLEKKLVEITPIVHVLLGNWVFRYKRYPDRSLRKFKPH